MILLGIFYNIFIVISLRAICNYFQKSWVKYRFFAKLIYSTKEPCYFSQIIRQNDINFVRQNLFQ